MGGSPVQQALGHMDRGASQIGFGVGDGEAEALVEPDVGGEGLVGQEAEFGHACCASRLLGMAQEGGAEALALMGGGDGDVLDIEVVGAGDGFDQGDEGIGLVEQVDLMFTSGAVIVGPHR